MTDEYVPADSSTVSVSYRLPTADDNLDKKPIVKCSPPSGSDFGEGDSEVKCTATDISGNTKECVFTITVKGG